MVSRIQSRPSDTLEYTPGSFSPGHVTRNTMTHETVKCGLPLSVELQPTPKETSPTSSALPSTILHIGTHREHLLSHNLSQMMTLQSALHLPDEPTAAVPGARVPDGGDCAQVGGGDGDADPGVERRAGGRGHEAGDRAL